MGKITELFSEGMHIKSVAVYHVFGVIFIATSFFMGIVDNPPGIIVLLLGVYVFAFPYLRAWRQKKKGKK